MSFTNSPLVSYTKLSPNHSGQRNHAIDTITIHCVVGQLSVETIGNIFAPVSRQASSNYGVGFDGRIGMYVEEKNRSWCTSSGANDHRAITIEVASDLKDPYAVNEKAYAAMLDLVTDICRRNGIKKLVWSTNKNDRVNHLNGCNMTVHRDYANKSCPGKYLYDRHGEIAAEVNKRLGATETEKPVTPVTPVAVTFDSLYENEIVNFKGGKHYASAGATSGSNAKASKAKITHKYKASAKHPVHLRAVDDNGKFISGVYGWCDLADIEKIPAPTTTPSVFQPYVVKVTTSVLNIRKGPGTDYRTNGAITDMGCYTIVEEKTGKGASKWGKLKSGAGWISLDYTKKI